MRPGGAPALSDRKCDHIRYNSNRIHGQAAMTKRMRTEGRGTEAVGVAAMFVRDVCVSDGTL